MDKDQSTFRPRVLLIAEAANPDMVSVPLVGWSHARALAEVADVHVVTQVRNRAAITKRGWREGEQFTALDTERIASPMHKLGSLLAGKRGGWTFITACETLSYYWFERCVWKRFGKSIKAGNFDIVHRLTPLSPAMPSTLAKRCKKAGVPFVLGPLNGGVPWPEAFLATKKREREWLSKFRGAIKLLPSYNATRQNASAILVASKFTYDQMPDDCKDRCLYLPENGIDAARFEAVRTRRAALPLRIVFVGRLVPLKGVDMLIESLAPLMSSGQAELTIIGEGPELELLKQLALEQGVSAQISFAGWVKHEKLAEELAQSDLLALPSIREFGGGVVLEAMAVGLVPVVVDYGGPGELVDDATGFKVPLKSRKQIVNDLRKVFQNLVSDPAKIDAMGILARERIASDFTWEEKAKRVLEVYAWVVGQVNKKPVMPPPRLREAEPQRAALESMPKPHPEHVS